MKLVSLFFISYLAFAQQQPPTPLQVARVYNITTSSQIIDNRSNQYQCDYFSYAVISGTGNWSVQLEYADGSSAGPWHQFTPNAMVTSTKQPPISAGNGYHDFVRLNTTSGNTVSNFSCSRGYFISSAGGGGGGTPTNASSFAAFYTNVTNVYIPHTVSGLMGNLNARTYDTSGHQTNSDIQIDSVNNVTANFANPQSGELLITGFAPVSAAAGGLQDPGANGVVFRSAYNTTRPATAADFPPVDSGTVTYNSGATGAVNSTVQNKLAEHVSVKDFGAKGDTYFSSGCTMAAGSNMVDCVNFNVAIPGSHYVTFTQANIGYLVKVLGVGPTNGRLLSATYQSGGSFVAGAVGGNTCVINSGWGNNPNDNSVDPYLSTSATAFLILGGNGLAGNVTQANGGGQGLPATMAGSIIVVTLPGTGFTAPPTTATLTNGTAQCSGQIIISSQLETGDLVGYVSSVSSSVVNGSAHTQAVLTATAATNSPAGSSTTVYLGHDDTPAFNESIAVVQAAGSGSVYVPTGMYAHTGISIGSPTVHGGISGLHLYGDGQGFDDQRHGSVLFYAGVANQPAVQTWGLSWSIIEQLNISGGGNASYGLLVSTLNSVNGSSHVNEFRNLAITNVGGFPGVGMYVSGNYWANTHGHPLCDAQSTYPCANDVATGTIKKVTVMGGGYMGGGYSSPAGTAVTATGFLEDGGQTAWWQLYDVTTVSMGYRGFDIEGGTFQSFNGANDEGSTNFASNLAPYDDVYISGCADWVAIDGAFQETYNMSLGVLRHNYNFGNGVCPFGGAGNSPYTRFQPTDIRFALGGFTMGYTPVEPDLAVLANMHAMVFNGNGTLNIQSSSSGGGPWPYVVWQINNPNSSATVLNTGLTASQVSISGSCVSDIPGISCTPGLAAGNPPMPRVAGDVICNVGSDPTVFLGGVLNTVTITPGADTFPANASGTWTAAAPPNHTQLGLPASGTFTANGSGTLQTMAITNGGQLYTTNPTSVTFTPAGLGTSTMAFSTCANTQNATAGSPWPIFKATWAAPAGTFIKGTAKKISLQFGLASSGIAPSGGFAPSVAMLLQVLGGAQLQATGSFGPMVTQTGMNNTPASFDYVISNSLGDNGAGAYFIDFTPLSTTFPGATTTSFAGQNTASPSVFSSAGQTIEAGVLWRGGIATIACASGGCGGTGITGTGTCTLSAFNNAPGTGYSINANVSAGAITGFTITTAGQDFNAPPTTVHVAGTGTGGQATCNTTINVATTLTATPGNAWWLRKWIIQSVN